MNRHIHFNHFINHHSQTCKQKCPFISSMTQSTIYIKSHKQKRSFISSQTQSTIYIQSHLNKISILIIIIDSVKFFHFQSHKPNIHSCHLVDIYHLHSKLLKKIQKLNCTQDFPGKGALSVCTFILIVHAVFYITSPISILHNQSGSQALLFVVQSP